MKDTSRFSFSTAALYPMESSDALSLIGRAGFRNAELMVQAMSDIERDSLEKMKRSSARVSSVHYPLAFFSLLYNANRSQSLAGRAFSERLVAAAECLGATTIVIHPTDLYEGDMKKHIEPLVLENIFHLASLADSAGVRVAMENNPHGRGRSAEALESYVSELGMRNIEAMVDTTEAAEAGFDPVDFLANMKGTPCHMHLSDYRNGVKHLPPGEGDFDWDAIFRILSEKNYRGLFVVEPSYRFYLEDREAKLRRDLRFLEEHCYG